MAERHSNNQVRLPFHFSQLSNISSQRPPMWTPYGLVPYGEVSQEQMAVSMMNPMMNPMMMNPMMSQMMRNSGYGPVQFPAQLQLARPRRALVPEVEVVQSFHGVHFKI